MKTESHVGDLIFFWILKFFALLFIFLFISMALVIFIKSWHAFSQFGFSFFVDTSWDSWRKELGALALIYGTVFSSLLALLLAVPISVAFALFLNEIAPRWLATCLGFLVEMLAAVPSIIYGMWGLFVLAPFLREKIQPVLSENLSYLPLFSGPYYGIGMMSAGIILAIMITPTISSLCKEVFKIIPVTNKEAVLTLGATRWEMFKTAILRGGSSGIMGAVFLGFGRAFGETMAVTMVIGNKVNLSASLFAPSQTMASILATQYAEADSKLHLSALTAVGFTLFVVSVFFNSASLFLIWRMKKKWRT
ncbi:MAG: phosphate ABC transporter permease subunit PstC [Bdellovibrionales bacterium]|nr:phosphate ABC transporter permease subunit PstC [Bdellovibrionales bacterium]